MVEQADFLNEVERLLKAFAEKSLGEMEAALRKNDTEVSGRLKSSLDAFFEASDADFSARVGIVFESYGRHVDRETKAHTKAAPLDAMLSFVKEKGLDSFKYVDTGKEKLEISLAKAKLGEDLAMKKIAYGLAKSKLGKKKEAKPFYNKIVYKNAGALKGALRNTVASFLAKEVRALWGLA